MYYGSVRRAPVALFFFILFSINAQDLPTPPEFKTWLPISDFERQQRVPIVEKDAGAEILTWRVWVADQISMDSGEVQRVFYNYIRVKIFDDKGKAAVNTISLPYSNSNKITDVGGRTIRADGSIVELNSKSIYRNEVARIGKIKESTVSFAMPGVESGSIVEYRWRQVHQAGPSRYLRLSFARELPVQRVTYFVRPLPSYLVGLEMGLSAFNCQPTPLRNFGDGWNETTVERVPATRDEPYMPAKPNLEPWALVYYRPASAYKDPKKYWDDIGKRAFNETKTLLKSNDVLKAAAAKINSEATSEDAKIAAAIAYTRASVKDIGSDQVTDDERRSIAKKVIDQDRTSTEILKSGIAFDSELNVVFAALAQQMGMDARLALVADRDERTFIPTDTADRYYLDNTAMAVKQGDSWKIFDVGRRDLKPGTLPEDAEGVWALVTDPKSPTFVRTSMTFPQESAEKRSATLRLGADGSLEGDVQESYTGHRAVLNREDLAGETAAVQEDWLKNRLLAMFGGAQVTGIKFANVDNASQPLEVSYHLKVPTFAQVTNRRILFGPIAFRRADAARFTANDRRYPIEFRSGWMESDELRITLPDGFSLENGENPGSMALGETGYYKLQFAVEGRDLVVGREFVFGQNRLLMFQPTQYPALKRAFDTIHVRDNVSLSLKSN